MQLDQETLKDLGVFHKDGGLFKMVDMCVTHEGSYWLKRHMQHPPSNYQELKEYQKAVQYWINHHDDWPEYITNGTLVMVDKYFTSFETVIPKPNKVTMLIQNISKSWRKDTEPSFVKFSISHIIDLVKGCHRLVTGHFNQTDSELLKSIFQKLKGYLDNMIIQKIINTKDDASESELTMLSYHVRREAKNYVTNISQLFAVLDGIRGMALATINHQWSLPTLLTSEHLEFDAESLYHPLINNAVPYDIHLDKDSNFLFLTGANMSGKSTLIRSIGLAAYMAHLGMGIAAKKSTISFLENVITNMQIEDNIFTGESYFFAEVKRMKKTADQLLKSKYNLVLMDELFKGTNVHDAYECTEAVIRALSKNKNNMMALSTHLYELANSFINVSNIQFAYCVTSIKEDGTYTFTYQINEGVSNDKIGYLVLKKERVLDALNQLQSDNPK